MKHLFCVILVIFSVVVGSLQAEEMPKYIELVGHEIIDDSVLHNVVTIVFSPDSKKAVTSAADCTIRLWDADSGKELHKWRWDEIPQTFVFTSDSKKVAGVNVITKETIDARIWDIESGKELPKLEREAFFDTFPLPRKYVGPVSTSDELYVQIWEDSSMKLRKLEGHVMQLIAAAYSPDHKKIVISELGSTVDRTGDIPYHRAFPGNTPFHTTVRVWDVESGKELHTLDRHGGLVRSLKFSPDGKKFAMMEITKPIAAELGKSVVRLWDADSGKELKEIEVSSEMKFSDFSPDGKKIVDHTIGIRIIDTESAKVQRLEMPERSEPYRWYVYSRPIVRYSIFSPDGKKIGLVGDYALAGIWVLE